MSASLDPQRASVVVGSWCVKPPTLQCMEYQDTLGVEQPELSVYLGQEGARARGSCLERIPKEVAGFCHDKYSSLGRQGEESLWNRMYEGEEA